MGKLFLESVDVPHEYIYFLLVAKCELIAERIGAMEGDFVIKRGIVN